MTSTNKPEKPSTPLLESVGVLNAKEAERQAAATGKSLTAVSVGAGSASPVKRIGSSVRGHDVKLPDGRVVNSWSEEYRRYCEAKTVFKRFKVKKTRQKYLADVYAKRGPDGYQDLYDEMLRIWKWEKGNKK